MKKILFTLFILAIATQLCLADTITINHFIIKENPFAKDEIAVVATDSLSNPLENVNGTFSFGINGFQEEMAFEHGVAFYKHKLDKSAFLYLKHNNETGTHARLYYIYKHDDKLTPFRISWGWLLVIPIALVLLAYLFRKFIIAAAIIFLVFLYFNYHNGLSFGTFFESIIDGLKNLF